MNYDTVRTPEHPDDTTQTRLAEEQRTANLISALTAVTPGGEPAFAAYENNLRGEIIARLGLTPDASW